MSENNEDRLPKELVAFYEALETNLVKHCEQWVMEPPDYSTDEHKLSSRSGGMNRYFNNELGLELVEVETRQPSIIGGGVTSCLFFRDLPLPFVPDGITEALNKIEVDTHRRTICKATGGDSSLMEKLSE